MTNLTSTMTVALIDNVSKPARTVAQALRDAEAQAKAIAKGMGDTGATDRFTKSLSRFGASKLHIEDVARAWKDYSKSANLAGTSADWTKAQVANVRAWERQTLDALRTVKREEQAFAQAQQRARQLASQPSNHGGLLSSARSKHGVIGYAAGTIAGGVAAGEILSLDKHIVKTAAHVEELRFRIRELSRGNPAEANVADVIAADISSRYPSITRAKALENYLETRANSVDEHGHIDTGAARRNSFAAARAQNAALALGFEMTPEDMQNLLKGVEGSGRAEDPKAVEKITDAYIRAKQVFGTAIASSMVRDYVANAKSANFSVGDDQFYLSNMVRMSEGNASRLGNEVNQTLSTLVGGSMKKAAGDWLVEYGLADGQKMVKTGGGNVKLLGGIKDSETLETDQSTWAKMTLRHAIESHGDLAEDKVAARMKLLREQELKRNPGAEIDEHFLRTRAEEGLISKALAKMGVRTTVSDNLAHFIGNERLIERDSKAMQNASGLDAGERLAQNPVAAWKEFTSSIETFAGVIGGPSVMQAGPVLHSLAQGISTLSMTVGDFFKANPTLATVGTLSAGGAALGGAGYLSYKIMTGFGLTGSAAALTGSAAALDAAAVRLGAASLGSNLPLKPKDLVTTGAVAGGATGGLASLQKLGAGALAVGGAAGIPAGAAVIAGAVGAGAVYGTMNALKALGAIDPTKISGTLGYQRGHQAEADRREAHQAHGPGRGMKAWLPPSKSQAARSRINDSALDATAEKAKETGDVLKEALGAGVVVNVNNAALDATLSKIAAAKAGLASLGDSMSGLKVPSLGATQRGHFSTGGVQGE